MEGPRARPSRTRLAVGVAIVTLGMIGGYLVGILVIGGGRQEVGALLWGVVGSFVGLFASAVLVRAILFRRWYRGRR